MQKVGVLSGGSSSPEVLVQQGVLCKLGMTSKHQQIANPSCGSGSTNKSQL